MKSINVLNKYDILIKRGIINNCGEEIKKISKANIAAVVTDDNVAKHYLDSVTVSLEEAGFNVLVVDTRCHGKSDGVYNTIGVKESRDVIAWSKFVCERFQNEEVWYHGICIGTASGIFAITSPDCPDTVKGFVTEGCFVSFRETFKRHMMADKRPLFPVLDLVMLHINRHTGTNVYRDTPMAAIKRIKKDARVLFLYGEHDIFSIPQKSRKLFAACSADDKKLVWFGKGGHSHLRINNTEEYDDAIISFFKD